MMAGTLLLGELFYNPYVHFLVSDSGLRPHMATLHFLTDAYRDCHPLMHV